MNNVVVLQPDNYAKTVLIIGVFHGDEPDGEYLINRFIGEVDSSKFQNRLILIPCLNAYGKAKNLRTNANGVDLNRNFPTKCWAKCLDVAEKNEFFGGESPASEEETKFVMQIIEEHKPDVILTLHAPYQVVNFDGPAQKIAKQISEITGYPVQENIGYPTPGSFGTYYGIERNIPVITLELPEDVSLDDLWEVNKNVFYYLANDLV